MNDAEAKHRQMQQEYLAEVRKVIDKNGDLVERAKGNLRARYDEEWKMFSVTIGEGRGADSISIDNDFVMCYDPDTRKIVAFELYNFHRLLAEESPFVRFCFAFMAQCGPVQMSLLSQTDFGT